jgi:hypothetical protein
VQFDAHLVDLVHKAELEVIPRVQGRKVAVHKVQYMGLGLLDCQGRA